MSRTAILRAVQRMSASSAFLKVGPHVVPAVDRAVHRLTRGRVLLSASLLPGVVLTARGARTGLPRTIPLAALHEPDADAWILVGSNFGRPAHPAWTTNLIAHPDAAVSWRGQDIAVRAELLTGEERAVAWGRLLVFWPPYGAYERRTERELRVFRLTRTAGG
ncbi:nitroreductase family deazaflavin-dependent oxidoreductase [Streptomyces sp. NPDC058953]|uniref:nitroreductase family deazaflavin-dependent oxidoreductase n=1 Tax=unclassified Streptomyces TaxID=2593676 RepID=UPI00369C72A8